MRVSNFFGMSYHFTPRVLDNINDLTASINTSVDQSGNKILFFDGAMPSEDVVYEFTSEAALRAEYTPIMEIDSLRFVYTYTIGNKKKLIKKLPVDALETTFLADGTIGWAAVIIEDDRGLDDKIILFTDSIGTWGQDDKPIIIDKFTGLAGDKNVFKDFSLILRDISSNEA